MGDVDMGKQVAAAQRAQLSSRDDADEWMSYKSVRQLEGRQDKAKLP